MYQVAVRRADIPRSRALHFQAARRPESRLAIWLFAGAILLLAILCVWSGARVTGLGYEISNHSSRLLRLKEINEEMRAEVAMLKAPGRLEHIARKRLGLRPPGNNRIIFLK